MGMRKHAPNSFPSDVMIKPPPNSVSSNDMKNYYGSCQALDGNFSNEGSFDNPMSKQASLPHGVFPPKSNNNCNVVVLDNDMSIVNDTGTNTFLDGLSPEQQLLQNRKRAANEDNTGNDNSNIVDKVAWISIDNDDQSQPQQPIQMRTNPYNSYVSRHECMAYVDRPPRKSFPSHMQMFSLIANCLDQSDIPLFLTLANSIRTYSQAINDFVVAFNEPRDHHSFIWKF